MNKNTLIITSTVFSICALVLAIYNTYNISNNKFKIFVSDLEYRDYPNKDLGGETPEEFIRKVYKLNTNNFALLKTQASNVYDQNYSKEKLKTLNIAETSISDENAVVFVTYSIGAELIRKTYWLSKVQGKWYQFNKYSMEEFCDSDWFKKMEDKTRRWEEASAKLKFNN